MTSTASAKLDALAQLRIIDDEAVFIMRASPDRRQRLFQIPQQILHRF